MASRTSRSAVAWIALVAIFLSTSHVRADPDARRYRAAMTKIFLSHYQAIPIYRLNPLSPGDVVELDNETVYLSHSRCYPNLKPKPLDIQAYESGTSIGLSARLKAGGELLTKELAKVNASVSATLDDTATITVTPLSETRAPDVQALRNVANAAGCEIIPALLDKSIGKYVVAFGVLNGRVRFAVTTKVTGQLDAQASGELIKLIAKTFSINDAEIKLSGNSASFVLSASPGDLPLALIPASYSFPELARITYFMQGNRGAQLKKLVDEAINAPDPGLFEGVVQKIREVLGKDELEEAHERWLERFFSGEKMMTTDELRERSKEVNFESVATYGAARELTKRE